jgi:ribosomal protein S18 acetylase RimI-like enzyme
VSRDSEKPALEPEIEVRVRRLHRRDLNRTWEFLKMVFRDVNRETVEYQRPRSKHRFVDIYDDDDVEQLLFDVEGEIVGYAECAFEISGSDNWLNPRYFDKRGMRPMFVEELAVHPKMQGRGVGGFMLEQLQHLARQRGSTHLVLEVAENNRDALAFYRHRNFQKLDAAIFMAQKIASEPQLLPPRTLKPLDAAKASEESDGSASPALLSAELADPAASVVATRYRAKTGSRVPQKPKRRKPRKVREADD